LEKVDAIIIIINLIITRVYRGGMERAFSSHSLIWFSVLHRRFDWKNFRKKEWKC